MRRLLVPVLLAVLAALFPLQPSAATRAPAPRAAAVDRPAARAELPSEEQWRADVRAVMAGSWAYLRQRVETADPGERLALNLDIDNTMLASRYAHGEAIYPVRRLTRLARRLGVAVLVNTARERPERERTERELARAGYRIDGLCLRAPGTRPLRSKPACRAAFRAHGYVLVANIGNNASDFSGTPRDFERGYRLPNYGGRLS